MKIVIDGAIPGTVGIWVAKIDPQQLLKLAKPHRQGGGISIILVNYPIFYDGRKCLEFDLGAAELLNLGSSNEAVFIDSRVSTSTGEVLPSTELKRNFAKGDMLFLQEIDTLPESIKELGKQLINGIRSLFPGELQFHPKSKKFVESPDNFWVVRIQPRDKSFRIVVYGSPEAHPKYTNISLANDMKSYSAFKLERQAQLLDTIAAIKESHRLKTSS
jgi:hypothetical protein